MSFRTGMTDDVHELTAAYALDALDDADSRRFEDHLDACERCRNDLEALRAAASELAFAAPAPAPPAALRGRIVAAARAERPNVIPLRRRRAWAAPAAAALASAVAVAAGAWAIVLSHRVSERDDALAVLSDPAARRLDLAGRSGVLVVARTGDAALSVPLARAPAGKEYEAWVITDRPHRAGMLGDGGRATLVIPNRLPHGATVAITLERKGGVDAPTSKPLATVRA
jgi:anti-sigma-K factor RskA